MEITLKLTDSGFATDPDCQRFIEALQQMLNRMDMSHHKYGVMRDSQLHGDVDAALTGRQRLHMYDGRNREDACDCEAGYGESHSVSCFLTRKSVPKNGTGNTENLLDAANCFVIEHLFPRHKKAHFKAQTTQDSPGIATRG
jgi:hypothetical protein